jgi:hypothetical protein
LLVECKEQDNGSLAVEVDVCHPNWDADEPLRIASIQSNPSDEKAAEPTLRCDFNKTNYNALSQPSRKEQPKAERRTEI